MLRPSLGILKWCVSSGLKNGNNKREKTTVSRIAEERFFIMDWSKESEVSTWKSAHFKQAVSAWPKGEIKCPKVPVCSIFTGMSNKTLIPLFSEQEEKRTTKSNAVARNCLNIRLPLCAFLFFITGKDNRNIREKKIRKFYWKGSTPLKLRKVPTRL